VVVDDGSTDGTRAVLAGLSDPRVRVILQSPNQGKGAALRRGFGEATYPFVVVQDADLEYDPAEYSILLEPLLNGKADVVFGSRFQGNAPHRVLYFWHSVGNRLLTLTSNMFTDLNLTDMETCYKLVRGEVLKSLPLSADRFGFEVEITARLAQAGARIWELPISYSGRTYAEGKKITWRDGAAAVLHVVRYNLFPPAGEWRSR
jgi:glycosyltransferase involved in cell wall biosynthesis